MSRGRYNPSLPIRGGQYLHRPSQHIGTVTRVLCCGSKAKRKHYVECEIVDSSGNKPWKASLEVFWKSWESAETTSGDQT